MLFAGTCFFFNVMRDMYFFVSPCWKTGPNWRENAVCQEGGMFSQGWEMSQVLNFWIEIGGENPFPMRWTSPANRQIRVFVGLIFP